MIDDAKLQHRQNIKLYNWDIIQFTNVPMNSICLLLKIPVHLLVAQLGQFR